eukprot:Protomagalhaensia_wolfi_Nauph_80__2909@NODE_2998_length_922_cov_4_815402_g2348_i0_p1_GENE_NODE_2998_length_922_cov_4_815402_g2348_i0NODE_2998_length_922_cov_4_815402_g2348_i0_p1_ORF_typecomplete_len130_score15_16TssO/PF17561_2/0_16DUF3087/PF11286_8/0_19_NODE_2998_length_922_cov_4_815402_g2348_i0299688
MDPWKDYLEASEGLLFTDSVLSLVCRSFQGYLKDIQWLPWVRTLSDLPPVGPGGPSSQQTIMVGRSGGYDREGMAQELNLVDPEVAKQERRRQIYCFVGAFLLMSIFTSTMFMMFSRRHQTTSPSGQPE